MPAQPPATAGFGPELRPEWLLEDGAAFLNHGSFGATPRRVLDAQSRWRERMERQPVRFLDRELPALMRDAAQELASFVGAAARDVVFVDNATAGVNAVVGSLSFSPGDEILVTSHVYGAVRKTIRHVAARAGATLVEVPVPFPLADAGEVVDAVARGLGPRTRLAVLDHVASASGLVLPIDAMIAACRRRGVPVLVDGAHGPGQLDLELSRLGADWYVGNCHKWLFAPKGCAFLWARPERQHELHPTVISHGYGAGWIEEFDWTGTRDPSPWLSVGAAIAFTCELGLDAMRRYQRELAGNAADLLAEAWGVTRPAPAAMCAAMVTLPLPWPTGGTEAEARATNRRLWDEHRVEVPVMPFQGRSWVRISAQVYNGWDEYLRLRDAVLAIRG